MSGRMDDCEGDMVWELLRAAAEANMDEMFRLDAANSSSNLLADSPSMVIAGLLLVQAVHRKLNTFKGSSVTEISKENPNLQHTARVFSHGDTKRKPKSSTHS